MDFCPVVYTNLSIINEITNNFYKNITNEPIFTNNTFELDLYNTTENKISNVKRTKLEVPYIVIFLWILKIGSNSGSTNYFVVDGFLFMSTFMFYIVKSISLFTFVSLNYLEYKKFV